jgi:BirA family biotin operon repressor/biotin-[acetyl-CoA-carboxylase] ligase
LNSFDCEKFKAALATAVFGHVLHFHPSLDSTNRLLMELALEGEGEGSLALAEEQSQGRGRWGRAWESPPGKSLLLSLLLRPPSALQRSQLTAVMGVAAQRVISRYAPTARIKWPNDLWVEGRKLSGLLLEASADAVIVGLGLNVNQDAGDFSVELQAASLKQCCGREISRESLLADLLFEMENLYLQWKAEGFDKIRRAWDEKACFIGEMVQAGARRGRALGLDSEGGLLIENEEGIQSLRSGEVSSLRPA